MVLGKSGRNSGRGKFENYDYTVGGTGEAVALDVDQKETERGSYSFKLLDMQMGERLASRKGFNFALRVKFLKGKREVGDYTVVPTSLLNDLIENAQET